MGFDFKKAYKQFYAPKERPEIITVPEMNYLSVRGKGDPNDPTGEYQKAVQALYSVAYTLKMSDKSDYHIAGFYEYVVPPLEGFWWQYGVNGVDYSNKDSFQWISLLRLPDFVKEKDVQWANGVAAILVDVGLNVLQGGTEAVAHCLELFKDVVGVLVLRYLTFPSIGGDTDVQRVIVSITANGLVVSGVVFDVHIGSSISTIYVHTGVRDSFFHLTRHDVADDGNDDGDRGYTAANH